MPNAERDRDLESIHEARQLGRAAAAAQRNFDGCTQEAVDAIVEEMASAGRQHSERLAEMAHHETGFGNIPDKIRKNNFVLEDVVEAMRGMRTVGVLREDREHGVREIAEPVGVVAGIIPSTNPTSTAMFKCLISIKARCGIVLSPHPSASSCVHESAAVMAAAADEAGAPEGIIGCMQNVSMQGTKELMNGRETDIILATGGTGLVKAAYSAGKPAYGVGPGNVPAYIERTANVAKAARDIISGTTFDNGTLCSSEQSIICDRVIKDEVLEHVRANGGHFLSADEAQRLGAVLITDKFLVNPDFVGRPATTIAAAAGISVPEGTRALVAPVDGVGKEYPLSHEKLSPVLAFYVVEDWQEGCTRCTELLRFGGMGHTMAIHSSDDDIVLQFGLRKPAHRILVNTVAALGAVGFTTHLFPSMTLGCGSWGNNITSDNVGPQHLLNVKRLAYETSEYIPDLQASAPTSAPASAWPPAGGRADLSANIVGAGATDGAASGAAKGDPLESQIAGFLTRRGLLPSGAGTPPSAGRQTVVSVKDADARRSTIAPPEPPRGRADTRADADPGLISTPISPPTEPPAALPVDFVAEDDVREAENRGEIIHIGPDTIITPSARELGEERGVFRRH
jgi:acetaldehyde dehydrogenase (acetylating)